MEGKKRAVVFGLGEVYKTFCDFVDYESVDIIAFSDNNVNLQGTVIDGKQVVKPEDIMQLDYDYVIVTCAHYGSIKKQLKESGIKEEAVLNFFDVYKRMNQCDIRMFSMLKGDAPIMLKYETKDKGAEEICRLQEKNLFLNAKTFINAVCDKKIASLEEVEFQVYSQFGEDGIIQWLIHNVEIGEKTFVEFGVEDYTEANTRFLLMNNNWSGLVMDGSVENINRLKKWKYLWKYDLLAIAEFITKDNINQLISGAGFRGDIGILSIDLDGNDYWILNVIDCVRPRILICEYNNIFGSEESVSVPYDIAFDRTQKHYSNLYWGASLGAYRDWAEKNGYYYVGSNSAGNNAFFVRKDCIKADRIPKDANLFVTSKYRESKDENGNLTYLRGRERLECIKEMEVINLKTNQADTIANIYKL